MGLVLVSSTVLAQPATEPASPSGATPGAAPPGEVDISVRQRSTLNPQEMLGQARQYQQAMGQVLGRINTLQDQARRQKDIIKLNCVQEKLIQAKVNIGIADQAMTSLQEHISRSDEGGRTHEFTRLTIINQKIVVLGAEAENCIGEDLSFVGATRVDVDVDPGIPQDDPTQPPGAVVSVDRPPPDRPPASSPST
jgi:hypothetical protein